jgi:4-hydroxyproline epimerase
MAERRDELRRRWDALRAGVVREPRGHEAVVGALLTPPVTDGAAAGVIFFNNVGYLGMCGHGAIGLVVTLGYLGRIAAGTHRIETPVGIISADYDGKNTVAVTNVLSFRHRKDVTVNVPEIGPVTGDIAWGGNWFFLADLKQKRLERANIEALTEVTWKIRMALTEQGITGADGAVIDHIEIFGPPHQTANHGRNFVLCPGKAYDRSPCGTGTSAKVACLAADGKLKPGEVWRQESIVGSVFEAWYTLDGPNIIPHIRGAAFVTAETTLFLDDTDPFRWGLT